MMPQQPVTKFEPPPPPESTATTTTLTNVDIDKKDIINEAALMGNTTTTTDLQSSQTSYSPYSQHANLGSPRPASNNNGNTKQRRTNIGKMFQTHICYKCDSRLAKLDCIKMHFKNKHPETPLDLNKVMISRVVCYICATRKKEYAMLGRHFAVEHRGHDIDPYKIGMDEPTPFNLSAEEEAELSKLPMPPPPNHDQYNKTMLKKQQKLESSSLEPMNDNTMDSLLSEPEQENNEQAKKPRRTPIVGGAFKNNKCLVCGKAFSRITTVKKHFLEHHSGETFDKSKIEVTQLPCYLCTAMFTDSRHAVRHFETNHPGVVFDAAKIRAPLGMEMTNGADMDETSQNLLLEDRDSEAEEDQQQQLLREEQSGFRCYMCNFWCSSLEAFQAHFSPESKAHDHIISHKIICPMCKEHMETTDEMFDHVTKKHKENNSLATSNNKNCVESC